MRVSGNKAWGDGFFKEERRKDPHCGHGCKVRVTEISPEVASVP